MEKNKALDNGGFISKGNVEVRKEEKKPVKKVNKHKRPGLFKRMGAKIKDIFSELKKVSWPTFAKVLKETGIVLAVVLVFLVVITAFDVGLDTLLKLITGNNKA